MIPVEITHEAQNHIIEMIKRDDKKNVILDIVQGGCNGYEYKWVTTDNNLDDDDHLSIRLSVDNVLYYKKSIREQIYASIISIKRDGLNKKLEIINPNVAYSCGCGESVNFK
jgi:iron-sulfur cluster assembly accessory protein